MEIQTKGHAKEIYEKLKVKLAELQSAGKIDQISKVDYNDAQNSAVASGTGFKSVLKCEDGKVLVEIELGFLLKPLRSKIEESVLKQISKALNA